MSGRRIPTSTPSLNSLAQPRPLSRPSLPISSCLTALAPSTSPDVTPSFRSLLRKGGIARTPTRPPQPPRNWVPQVPRIWGPGIALPSICHPERSPSPRGRHSRRTCFCFSLEPLQIGLPVPHPSFAWVGSHEPRPASLNPPRNWVPQVPRIWGPGIALPSICHPERALRRADGTVEGPAFAFPLNPPNWVAGAPSKLRLGGISTNLDPPPSIHHETGCPRSLAFGDLGSHSHQFVILSGAVRRADGAAEGPAFAFPLNNYKLGCRVPHPSFAWVGQHNSRSRHRNTTATRICFGCCPTNLIRHRAFQLLVFLAM